METEMQNLDAPSHSQLLNPEILEEVVAGGHEVPKYTSLKDIMPGSPSLMGLGAPGPHDSGAGGFDAASISIRNQLVKHAASAYLQSAAILASRKQNCLKRAWRRVSVRHAAFSSVWRTAVQGPLGACMVTVVRSVRRLVAYMVGHIGGVWTASATARRAPIA